MTNIDDTFIDSTATVGPGRQIRLWGSLARLIVGAAMIAGAALSGADRFDAVIGLAVFPMAEVGLLALRGRNAAPLRLFGNSGYCINWGIGVAAFSLLPQAALLFYGTSILLAFVRGYAGCEIFAISNWLRRRDDQIVCPVFSPIDHAEARRAGIDPSC
jgi:hypothetical protein